jgi:FMN phosphatase YigB (HAD superfamily)
MVRYLFFDFFGTLVRYDREIRDASAAYGAAHSVV